MKKILKSQKGIISTDALIAIAILALFSGLILTISYNIFLSNSSLKRMSTATKYITDVFEYVDKLYYDDVALSEDGEEETELEKFCNNLAQNGITVNDTWDGKGYNIVIEVKPYSNNLDLVKTINMSVIYKLNGKDQTISMSRIKKREDLTVPNRPNIDSIEKEETENIYPIKYTNGIWKVTNVNDANWYNYQNGNWAAITKTTETLEIGAEANIEYTGVLVWVPRYAYNNNQVEFLFQTTDKYVDTTGDYDTLEDIDTGYTIEPSITGTGKWITINDVSKEQLNSIYEMQGI